MSRCPYHDGNYVSANFMRRFVYEGDVVAARIPLRLDGRIFYDVPRGSVQPDTHLLACAHKHGQQVHPIRRE